MDTADAIMMEYNRIFTFSLPPAVLFSIVNLIQPLGVFTPYNNPLVFLGLLTIFACFIFDDEGPDGFFVGPAHGNRDKGIRWMAIKILELGADSFATTVLSGYSFDPKDSGQEVAWVKSLVYVYIMTVMTTSFLRGVNIYALSVATVVRIGGRWTSWAPFDR